MPRRHWCYFLGNYPDRSLIVPTQYPNSVNVNMEECVLCVKMCIAFW